MPLNQDAKAFLEKMIGEKEPFETSIEEFRARAAALIPSGTPLDIGKVQDHTIPGGDGQPLNVRTYIPRATKPLPVVVWLHGGSFVRGTPEMFDAGRRALAVKADCVIVAVDQRLSPETQFPKPLEDGYAALLWTAEHIDELGGGNNFIGVGGESSGGSIAAALALYANERDGPRVAFQILMEPLLDASLSSASVEEFATGYVLTKAQLDWAYNQYAPGDKRQHPLVSPLFQATYANNVPAAIVTIEFDPVRDDGERYAEKLRSAGVIVHHTRVEGYVHHFPGPDAVPALTDAIQQLFAEISK